jgi:hypothetical protein
MNRWLLLIPIAGLLIVAAWWAFRFGRQVHVERARELFRLQHRRLEEQFLKAARATGKPRNLHWAGCEFTGDPILARERHGRRLTAIVPMVVQFEAIAGSDMEGLPAVDQAKRACAIFTFARGEWTTTGRAVFNLSPDEVVRQFARDYEPVQSPH